jgi:hypothetical protein
MATANDHLISKERCRIRAERSANEDVRRVWLSLAETYGAVVDHRKDRALRGSHQR